MDFIKNNLGNVTISLGETENIVKINLYRNIIKNSFSSMLDIGRLDVSGNIYHLYKIEEDND